MTVFEFETGRSQEVRSVLAAGFREMAEVRRSPSPRTPRRWRRTSWRPARIAFLSCRQAARDARRAGRDLERIADDVIMPADARFGDPIVTDMETANGPAIKVKQFPSWWCRNLQRRSSRSTLFAHLWIGPTPDIFVGVQAWFASPVEAELAEEALDQLASSINVCLRAPSIQVERSHPGVRYRLAVPDGWTSFPVQAARLRPAIAGGCFADSRTDLGTRQSPCAAERRTSWCSSRSRPESSTPSSSLSFRLTCQVPITATLPCRARATASAR